MSKRSNLNWPVLTEYDQDHLSRIALPLGGIGTGTVSLGGRGDLRDWEIVNRPAKGFSPKNSFFALYAKPAGGKAVTRALEGLIESHDYEGAMGCVAPNPGLPRFRRCSFRGAYPLGQVLLSDPNVPVKVRIEAFNPLIPGDSDTSGIPVAILRFVLINKTARSVSTSVCGSVQNFIGTDGTAGSPNKNINTFRKATKTAKLQGMFMRSKGVDPKAEQYGTMALTTTARTGVTYRDAWANLSLGDEYGDSLRDFWDDFSEDGKLDKLSADGVDAPVASLAVSVTVPPHSSKAITFMLSWHFPNRRTWTPADMPEAMANYRSKCDPCVDPAGRVGNYYTTQYRDAWDVAVRTAGRLAKLEAQTVKFVRSFCDSDLPAVVKEAALYNISTLRTQTCFRTEDGHFYGWEGCWDDYGCCYGSCTHVWNYEQATAFLFGDLARSMREIEFFQASNNEGMMNFRVGLPRARAKKWSLAAADGQMGCIVKLYRDWQLSGDDELLRKFWPKVRKALEFCWIPGGWDADRDGVMEGCQHNTLDAEYFGPNPPIGTWYLAALRATEQMARYLGEDEFADVCCELFDCGSRWTDRNLFNGEYYQHQIRPAKRESDVAAGLRHPAYVASGSSSRSVADPDLQLGAGCLIDQLVGQYMAHVCGLGYLLDRAHVRKTLSSLMKYNFKKNLFGHFTHLRSFALNDESGMVLTSYPKGCRPKRPVHVHNEIMTGFEYTAAVHMIYEGQTDNALTCISAIRSRYDGRKRNPFNEAECGHHYARAMASWAAVSALSGFRYSGVERSITFVGKEGTYFWSNGYAWGTCKLKSMSRGFQVKLALLHGKLLLKQVRISGVGSVQFGRTKSISAGRTVTVLVEQALGGLTKRRQRPKLRRNNAPFAGFDRVN